MAHPQQQQLLQAPPLFLDTLYCSEEHWEEEEEEEEEEEVDDFEVCCNNKSNPNPNPPDLLEHDLFWEDEELISLISKEKNELFIPNLETNLSLEKSRREAVEWMLKVHLYHSFSALTAVLAVDYFDRFILSFQFQREKPWMTQLAAVACLSLAAKMEETQVPLLLDFQVEESKYVFEAKTIQRMEILVLSTLQWKMNPVTPLSFLDFITRRLGLKNHLCWEFLRRCELVLLSLLSDARYMSYLPSVMATATMLHVVNSVEPCILAEYQNQLLGILGIDKDKVDKCCDFVVELTSRIIHGNHQSNKRKLRSVMPGSPNGVIDVSFSSDSSNDSWAAAASASSSVCSSPVPLTKKSKTDDDEDHQYLSLPF